jgi:hypothetical protein
MMKRIDDYTALYAGLNRDRGLIGRYAKLYSEFESSLGRGA